MSEVKIVPLNLSSKIEPSATLQSWGFVNAIPTQRDLNNKMQNALLSAWKRMDEKLKENGY